MVSETRFAGFWPWADNRKGHFNMATRWARGRRGGRHYAPLLHLISNIQQNVCASTYIFNILSGLFPLCLAAWRFRHSDAERRMHLGSRRFYYTESSCFSSGSRPLRRLPSTQNWRHGTNNIVCYSNFALVPVICPSAVTSVADRADVPVSLPVFSPACTHWRAPGCSQSPPPCIWY